MNWLTREEVQTEAKKGEKEALLCSITPWTQIVVAGYKQFAVACNNDLVYINSSFCSLCQYKDLERTSCETCLLCKYDGYCNPSGGGLWWKVHIALKSENSKDFEDKAKQLRDKLIEIYNLEFGEQNMKAKIDFGNGKIVELSQESTEKLRKELLEPEKERKWLVAQSDSDEDNESRVILNLFALSESAKAKLQEVLTTNCSWISFDSNGGFGAYSNKINGLTFYSNTKIIFGGEQNV